jgi:HlyD family secretion protein
LAQVNATGTILPERQTMLGFKSPGRVDSILVDDGQFVEEGELLAQLDTADLAFAVAQSELALATAQAQLLRLQQPPSEGDIKAAEAALESAQASHQRLLEGPLEEEVRVARANLDQARAALDQAQAAYDRVASRPDIALLPQSLQLQQATIALEAAEASFELTMRSPSKAEVTAARSAIVQAEASLARLQEGVSDEEIRISQLQVAQAQLSLDQARHQLDGAKLFAPHSGTITQVGIAVGEQTAGQPAFALTDLTNYHIDLAVDEIDIGRVLVGQPASATLDAFPSETLSGQVSRIAKTAQLDAGIVTYQVSIELEETDLPLRAGMTANVDIITERRDNVLLVPNRFVRVDRTTGQAFVDMLTGDALVSLEIQIGLRDEAFSQVLAGLEEGDLIVLVQESSRERLRQLMEMGPP